MKYADIVPDYGVYLRLQGDAYTSFEGEVARWCEPQLQALKKWFGDLPRSLSILDLGCGDGTGLAALAALGFWDLTGVDLNPAKLARARQAVPGAYLVEGDLHALELCDLGEFDVLYSSHALEHCYQPGRVLDAAYSLLRRSGTFFVILPYPDGGVDEAHGGKYELGTVVEDDGMALTACFLAHGFELVTLERATRDGPEVRLVFRRLP